MRVCNIYQRSSSTVLMIIYTFQPFYFYPFTTMQRNKISALFIFILVLVADLVSRKLYITRNLSDLCCESSSATKYLFNFNNDLLIIVVTKILYYIFLPLLFL